MNYDISNILTGRFRPLTAAPTFNTPNLSGGGLFGVNQSFGINNGANNGYQISAPNYNQTSGYGLSQPGFSQGGGTTIVYNQQGSGLSSAQTAQPQNQFNNSGYSFGGGGVMSSGGIGSNIGDSIQYPNLPTPNIPTSNQGQIPQIPTYGGGNTYQPPQQFTGGGGRTATAIIGRPEKDVYDNQGKLVQQGAVSSWNQSFNTHTPGGVGATVENGWANVTRGESGRLYETGNLIPGDAFGKRFTSQADMDSFKRQLLNNDPNKYYQYYPKERPSNLPSQPAKPPTPPKPAGSDIQYSSGSFTTQNPLSNWSPSYTSTPIAQPSITGQAGSTSITDQASSYMSSLLAGGISPEQSNKLVQEKFGQNTGVYTPLPVSEGNMTLQPDGTIVKPGETLPYTPPNLSWPEAQPTIPEETHPQWWYDGYDSEEEYNRDNSPYQWYRDGYNSMQEWWDEEYGFEE